MKKNVYDYFVDLDKEKLKTIDDDRYLASRRDF